ncbi:MAG: ferritin-like domain-containing protein [Polyangiaceae bacterium]|nr:ferritin-like domain-containing protein [Polyangiaceae bacterium]
MTEGLTLRKVIEFAALTEEVGAGFYQRMAARFSDKPEVAAVFSQLAQDEKVHHAQFQSLLSSAPAAYDDLVEYERGQYLRAMAVSEFFAPNAGPFRDADQIKDADEALWRALELEKAALGYYRAIRDELGPSEAIDSIVATEKDHLLRLMKVVMTGAKFRSLQDVWP